MSERKKVTLPALFEKVAEGEPITWLTCYDYPTAYFQEQAGVDMILVGDSLGMTMLGYDSTLPVTMEDMIRHTQAVRRGAPTAFVIGDMPYMSYQPSVETAVRNAGRFMAEAGCDAHQARRRGGDGRPHRRHCPRGHSGHGPPGINAAERQRPGRLSPAGQGGRCRPRRSSMTPRRWKKRGLSASCWNWCRIELCQHHHRARRELHHHEPGFRPGRAWPAAHLP